MKLAIALSHVEVLAAVTAYIAERQDVEVTEVQFALNSEGEVSAVAHTGEVAGEIETKAAPAATRRSAAKSEPEAPAAEDPAPAAPAGRTRRKPAAAPAEPEYDEEGFNKDGFDKDGFDRDGFDKDGFDCEGYNDQDVHRDDIEPEQDAAPEPEPAKPVSRRRGAAATPAAEPEAEEAKPAGRSRRAAAAAPAKEEAPEAEAEAPARTRRRIFNK